MEVLWLQECCLRTFDLESKGTFDLESKASAFIFYKQQLRKQELILMVNAKIDSSIQARTERRYQANLILSIHLI